MGVAHAAVGDVKLGGHGGGGLAGGGGQSHGGVGHEQIALIGVVGVHTLGLGHGVQVIEQGGVPEVGDVEGVVVAAGLVGIVVQLHLGHVAAVHGEVGLGGHSAVGVGQTRALAAGRVVQALLVLVHQGLGSAHEQGTHQGVGVSPVGLAQAVLRHHMLLDQSGDTGQVGGGHGGAAHQAVGAVVHGGVDVAAGGGDVRLQGQGGGDAPGGEVAHLVGGVAGDEGLVRAHGEGQVGVLLQSGEDVGAVCHGDGGTGHGDGAVRHVHDDGAALIVVHQAGHSPSVLGVLALLGEGDDAALHQSDFAGHVHGGEVLHSAGAGHGYHLIGGVGQGVQGCVDAAATVLIGDLIVVAHSDVVGHVVGVLHTGHRQGVGVGAGVAQHAVVRVGGEVGVEAEGVALAHGVGVTGGDAQHGAGLGHPVKHLIHPVHVGGEA